MATDAAETAKGEMAADAATLGNNDRLRGQRKRCQWQQMQHREKWRQMQWGAAATG